MKKVLVIAGTRPEVIKVAPVVLELNKHTDQIKTVLCCTGQHRELLSGIFDLFGLTVDHNLDLMVQNQTLSGIASRMFPALEEIIRTESPDWILAQGDTVTVMVASILSYYSGIKFGHIEAGLRTGDLHSPYPEEGNRMIADTVAHRLWTPTEKSRTTLINSGIDPAKIKVTGNTVIDALKIAVGLRYNYQSSPVSYLNGEKIVLVTAHRRESFGSDMENIYLAVREIARTFKDMVFVCPVHLNPNVREVVNKTIRGVSNIHLHEPLDYQDFIHLMKKSFLVLTDSGGIQEEAPFFDVPVLVIRNKTERLEGVEAGVAILVGTEKQQIIDGATQLIENNELYNNMAKSANPYGDGNAAKHIVAEIVEDV